MVHERPVAVTQFGRWWATMTAVFSEALAPGTAPAAAVAIDGPPPSNNSAQEVLVRWCELEQQWRLRFGASSRLWGGVYIRVSSACSTQTLEQNPFLIQGLIH
jgi:hypothetical protein